MNRKKLGTGVLALLVTLLPWPCIAQSQARFRRMNLNDGLSQSSPGQPFQDSIGYMWLGSLDGLNRFDGYEIKVFRPDPDDPHSITGVKAIGLFEDQVQNLWIVLHQGGINRYDRLTNRFIAYRPPDAEPGLTELFWAAFQCRDGSLLLGTESGLVRRFRPDQQSFEPVSLLPNQQRLKGTVLALHEEADGTLWVGGLGFGLYIKKPDQDVATPFVSPDDDTIRSDTINRIVQDQRGDIWVCTKNGLFRIDGKTHAMTHYRHQPGSRTGLSDPEVFTVMEDSQGRFWVGSGGGLSLMNREMGTFQTFRHQPGQSTSLSSNRIVYLYEDRDHLIWASTFGAGINIFDPRSLAFNHLTASDGDAFGLTEKLVWGMYEAPDGTVWIGMSGGGLNAIRPRTSDIVRYRHDDNNPDSLASDTVRAVQGDRHGNIWLGTQGGGLDRLDPTTNTFSHHQHHDNDPTSLSDNWVLSLHFDRTDQLWVGTYLGGLNRMEADGHFRRYSHDPQDPQSLAANRVWDIDSAADGTLWIGTVNGLNHFDPATEKFTRYQHDPENPRSLTQNIVGSVLVDRNGQVWAGTPKGVNRMTKEGHFIHYRRKNGLLSEYTYGILEDQRGFIWLSSNQGLSCLDPTTDKVRSFVEEDGLQSNEFNAGSFHKSPNGRLYFGGINGFNAFYPEQVEAEFGAPSVVLTDFLLQNQSIRDSVSSGQRVAPDQMSHVDLTYKDYQLSFEFAALHYAKPHRTRYAYQLEGLDKHWIETDALRRYATYTRLAPGSYTFRVKAATEYGPWTKKPVVVTLQVAPPPWQTWWAYTLYVLMLAGLILSYVRIQQIKLNRSREIAEKERRIAARLRQVDALKDEFLANTSHELRTPLNGIIGLAESLADGVTGPLPESTQANLSMIIASGKRLASLVDDILDFSKLRDRDLQLRKGPVDMHALTEVVVALSRPLLAHRPVTLINTIEPTTPPVWGDENRLQQIMHNLIGNAVKFTERGEIRVTATVIDGFLEISVHDTGPGIPEEDHERIFESFEQVDGESTRHHGGTGLGLALSRQLVGLHGGAIRVVSAVGVGSCFSFSIPLSQIPVPTASSETPPAKSVRQPDVERRLHPDRSRPAPTRTPPPFTSDGQPPFVILVVDDEPINRQVIRNHLTVRDFHVWEASSGAEALAMVPVQRFDLILLDVMMPRMNGYEVCQTLRQTHSLHELPILFLTARNQVSDLKLGFEVGANDYLTKPIDKDELLLRLKTHLELLDAHRNLEAKVAARTMELEERNRELDQRNQEILRTRDQLILSEKMASLGTLAAGIAHEIRNPLTFITGFAEVSKDLSQEISQSLARLEPALDEEALGEIASALNDLSQNAQRIQEHGNRANQIVQNMILLARGEQSEKRAVPLNALIHEFLFLAWQSACARNDVNCELKLHEEYDPRVGEQDVSPQSLSRALISITANAVEAIVARARQTSDYEGLLKVWTQLTADAVLIGFLDNGIGIPESKITQIMTPFYTTKTEDAHLGLGLSLVYEIVTKEHGGTLEISSEEGSKTELVIRLPLRTP